MTRGEWPARYEIRVAAGPDDIWSEWFDWLHVDHDDKGGIVLTGTVPDQSALRGVLGAIQDLGLTITHVRRLDARDEP